MRSIYLVLLLTIFTACNGGKAPPVKVEVEPIATAIASPTPDVTASPRFTVKCLNCDARELKIFKQVEIAAMETIATPCFFDHFTLTKYRSDLIQTNGLTRSQVVEKIRTSSIKEIPVKMYYDSRSGVYGYTYPNDPTLYFNRWYRTQEDYGNGDWSIASEASNFVHEVTHKLGFDHDFRRTSRRPYSVPYTANYAIDNCIAEKYK